MQQLAPIVISTLALAFSAFTFYWNNLRKRKAFYLLRVSPLASFFSPQFALINGGSSDILVTSLACRFDNNREKSGFYPAARITCDGASSMLIESGKSYHYIVEFAEAFTSTFAASGEKDPNNGEFFVHPMYIEIEWVEVSGKQHKSSVPHSEFGFDAEGNRRFCKPLGEKYDLFASPQL